MKKKIILDADPGIDDAVALLMALNNPALEVLAVTTANGNVNVNRSTYNALRIMEAAGREREVVVARGAARPLFKRPFHSAHVHGPDGLGGAATLPRTRARAGRKSAVRLIEDLITTHRKKEITLVGTAPLTNIAMLLERVPSVAKRIAGIVLMGGAYGLSTRRRAGGNVTPYAEFNFYCDPEAADRVLNSGAEIVAAGLDVTTNPRCAVTRKMLRKIGMLGGGTARVASSILSEPVLREGIFHLHDVFALASLLHPGIFETVRCRVRVEHSGKFRGRCIASPDRNDGRVRVCSSVDHAKFLRFLLDSLRERGSWQRGI